jgi:adenine-specific DNA-methyltransferase
MVVNMKNDQLKTAIISILKQDDRLWNKDKTELNQTLLLDKVDKIDEKIIELLLHDKQTREEFFVKIKDVYVFKSNEFKFFMEENKENNSYTQYKNRIGLTDGKRFLNDSKDVVLNFPYKDCVLEGGQSTEEGLDTFFEYEAEKIKTVKGEKLTEPAGYKEKQSKRKEIFFNEVLAHDEIDRLYDEKALVNWKRFTKDGEQEIKEIKRDEYGTIKENLIIKGNNLLALHSLKKQFAGKVKLIYIDPPYNTGNDGFKYNDNYNHSTWLTFMKNRLEVARVLLRDDGFIFVQCDDNEQAYLKVLMDDVFGRDNFINVVSARMKNIAGASGGGEDKRLKKNIEFINIFAKNYYNSRLESAYEYTEIWKLVEDYKSKNISWKYTSIVIDYGEKEYIKSTKDGDGNEIKIYKRGNPLFKSVSQVAKDEKLNKKEVYYKYIDRIFTTAMPQSSIRTRVLDSLKGENKTDFISIEYIPKSGKNKGKVYEQYYKGDKLRLLAWLKDVVEKTNGELYKKDLQGTFWDGFNLNNLSKEGDTVFKSGKKPEELIKKVLDISTTENDIVLDYHLGSGTTTAVAHKMRRQYIGIEQLDYGENDSVVRQKKAIAGEQGGISKSINWQGGGDFIYFELAKWNEKAKENILTCNNLQELEFFIDTLYEKYFLNYTLKIKEFKEKVIKESNFKKLSLDEQKKMFLSMLDLNQMYVQKTEMADKRFDISEKEQKLTSLFYNNEEQL